jgi:hypothetical protein
MGGPTARYFWERSAASWDGWGPITALHGRVLTVELGGRNVPVVLSVHPYQRTVESRPEVIARAIADRLTPGHLAAEQLKAA